MNLDNTYVGIQSDNLDTNLREIPVFVVDNPYDADELVWLTQDTEKADIIIRQLATPFRADRKVYIVEPTAELSVQFSELSPQEFKLVNIRESKPFTHRNAGLTFVDKIVILKS